MTRFRPTVETLGARALPSAVLAGPTDATPEAPPAVGVYVADTPAQSGTGNEAELSLNFTKITFNNLVTSKVAVQDFHFTAKADKASPG